jgi:ComF family protein
VRVPAFTPTAIDAIAGILYPPRCFLCLGPLASPREGVCPACRAGMRRIGRSHPLRVEGGSRLRSGGDIDDFLALFLFEKRGPLQGALHLLKYSGMHSLGVWLGRELGAAVAADPEFDAGALLVPVPLHPARLRERGFNQAENICEGIAAVTGMPVAARILERARNTPSQTTLKFHQREENVRGAFRVGRRKEGPIRGKTVVIVDDVMTTGSTLVECGRALHGAGAARVIAATVAVADHAA